MAEPNNCSAAAAEKETHTETSKPARTYSAPAFPAAQRLSEEYLRTLKRASGGVQTTHSQSLERELSLCEIQRPRSVGGIPMERQGARRGDVGGSLGTPTSMATSSQNSQEQARPPTQIASDPSPSHQNSQTLSYPRTLGGEPMVRGGGFYCQGNGPNPGEKRHRDYYVPPSKAPGSDGT
jgi:hypothetical protein